MFSFPSSTKTRYTTWDAHSNFRPRTLIFANIDRIFQKKMPHELVNISPQHHLLPSMFNLTVMLDYFRNFIFSSKRKKMKGLPWCLVVVPFRLMPVSRWSTKGRSAAGSLRSAVRMSGGGELCADWGGITHDWTKTESSDGARAAWLTSPVCYIMYKALLKPSAI